MGWKTTFAYNVNLSTGTGLTTVTDPDGNTTVDDYSQGTLIAESGWTGGTNLVSEQDYVPDQTASGNAAGTQLDLASMDGDGNITSTTYDSSGNLTTSTAPDGVGSQTATTTQQSTSLAQQNCSSDATATSTCTSSPGPSPVAPGGTITPPSSAPPQGLTWTLYDTYGNQLYSTIGVYEPGSNSAAYSQTTYQLYENNTVTLGSNHISCTASPPAPTLPCATINADGVVTQLAYNAQGDLTSSSTPDGNSTEVATTTYGYDGDGEQTSTTSPDGNLAGANSGNYTTTSTYNSDGQDTSDAQGAGAGYTDTPRVTNYGYDGDGNKTTIQDARGFTTTTTYNADDQATLITDPDGNATLSCYDGDGNTTQTVPPAGVAANNLTPAMCPQAYPSGYGVRLASDASTSTFDAQGNDTQNTTPAPAGQTGPETTTYAYDGDGNLTRTTAPPTSNGGPNQVTVATYTSSGQAATETTAYGTAAASTVSYCYDPNGDQTSVVYPDGNTSGTATCETAYPWVVSSGTFPTQASYQTTSGYDSAGELVTTTSPATSAAPAGATSTSTYDAAGNTLTSTDPNGVTTTRTYTPLNNPATVTYSGGTAHSVTYGYDASGNRVSMSDATGNSSYVWDQFGELTSATNGAGKNIIYGYNPDGEITGITYPLGSPSWASTSTVSYGYDNADVLTSLTDFNGKQISITPNADGLPAAETLGTTGDTITTAYDNTDAPSSITLKNGGGTTLQSFTYTDSPAGTILNEADTPSSPQTPAVYTYDAQSRVTSMTPGTGGALSYSFDASSNLTTLPSGASGNYNNAGELTSSTFSGTTTTYSYDADGQQLTSKQGSTTITSGTWNGAGELTAYSSPAASMTGATYNGDGLRASANFGAGPQAFTWNTMGQVPRLLTDANNAYIYGNGTEPLEQVRLTDGHVTYLVQNRLGSVCGIVDSAGTLVGSTSYDAWGEALTSGGLAAYSPFGYAGGYTDSTGLAYLIGRYYNSATGQFTSLDPDIRQTLSPYQYGMGDPVAVTDPSGDISFLRWHIRGYPCIYGFYHSYYHWCDLQLAVDITNGPDVQDQYWVRFRVTPGTDSTKVDWTIEKASSGVAIAGVELDSYVVHAGSIYGFDDRALPVPGFGGDSHWFRIKGYNAERKTILVAFRMWVHCPQCTPSYILDQARTATTYPCKVTVNQCRYRKE